MACSYSIPLLSQPHSTFLFLQRKTKSSNTYTSNPPKLKLKTESDPFPVKSLNNLSLNKHKQNTIPTTKHYSQFLMGLCTNMWWAKLKSAIGQRFNLEGIILSTEVLTKNPNLLLPHLKVPDIRYINWEELHRRGFKGVIFDKDNTVSLPYALTLWDPLKPSVENCKNVFGEDNVAIFSNSVGLYEFDPDESKSERLEKEIGMRVIRHMVKKPAGNGDEIEKQLCCEAMEIVMVGDRRFTDVVFGNKNGFLTVLTEPLTVEGENFVVKFVRKFEEFVVENKCRKGFKSKDHCLLGKCDVHLVTLDQPL